MQQVKVPASNRLLVLKYWSSQTPETSVFVGTAGEKFKEERKKRFEDSNNSVLTFADLLSCFHIAGKINAYQRYSKKNNNKTMVSRYTGPIYSVTYDLFISAVYHIWTSMC